ncbi:alpha-protein kinase 3 [Varanus komodoensis]|uniref:alpha-protein kinase 3 n=1 Tax=Varanus komodoensis TaxID=61221 RepID=UPI001CF78D97|nr:alpha-protein kinase 3 [Varanus komodoensis]
MCIVTGYPQPEVTWYKDEEEMDRYCGLPKYEIFRHGNRHTLQLYKCKEEDAAIYQASARNSKGIVSCSGVLEVGTMTEYRIHQRWFARLKRNAEAKLREIEQSRKRGKENVEVELLRRVSPDRFQRKRRLTGEVGMRSGTSLWDREEVAKVRVPEGKPRFGEDEKPKSKEPALRASTALLSKNFITGQLEADMATNGDSSLQSGEENGEEDANGFLSYIYETVEKMKTKPTTKDFAAKKKKKEEGAAAVPKASKDASRQEDGTRPRRNISPQKEAKPVPSPRKISPAAKKEHLKEAEPKESPSRVAKKPAPLPRSAPSNTGTADVYFSLKEMYFENEAKPEVGWKAPEAKAGEADTGRPGVDASASVATVPETSLGLKGAKTEPGKQRSHEERKAPAAGPSGRGAKAVAVDTAAHSSTPLGPHPEQAAQPTAESLQSDERAAEMDAQPVGQASETDLGSREDGRGTAGLIRETDLPEDLPAAAEPAQQPQETTPDSSLREETNQETGYFALNKGVPGTAETKRPEEQIGSSPESQELSEEDNQDAPRAPQAPPAFDPTPPTRKKHLRLKEDVGRPPSSTGSSPAPNLGRAELVAPRLAYREANNEAGPEAQVDGLAWQEEAESLGKQEEMLPGHKSPGLKMDRECEDVRPPAAAARPFLPPECAADTPVPPRGVSEEPGGILAAASPPAGRKTQEAAPLPPEEGSLMEGTQSVAHLLREVKGEMETQLPAQPAPPESEQQGPSAAGEQLHVTEGPPVPPRSKGKAEEGFLLGKKPEVRAAEPEKTGPKAPGTQDSPQLETAMEEEQAEDKAQHSDLVSSLKNYLLLLLKLSTEQDNGKGSPKREAKAVEGRSPPTAIPRHLPDVGIAGLTPRTSRKIFERVETNQLFQSAESVQLTPKTSRRLTGMINREMMLCQEGLLADPEAPALPCIPSIVVGGVPGEPAGLPELSPETSSEAVGALPSATPQELASGARRKIFLPKAKQAEEAEGAEGHARPKRDSPSVSPQQGRRNAALLQTSTPGSPPAEKRSPTLARKMAMLEVPKMYEEPAEESPTAADLSLAAPEGLEEPALEVQATEPRKANDPFKAPQVIRKIRAEQFSDASGNLKLWCQFFNILSDSKLTWYKDEVPVASARRSSGDEGQAALAIVQVSLKDRGVYQCTIQNEYGTDSTDFLLSAEVLSGFISKEETEAGEEIEMTPMVFAKGLADSGFWGDKLFGRIMVADLAVGQGFLHKACRARAIYGLEPVFESGLTGIIKIRNLIAFGGRSESTLVERNYEITIQECKIQNSSREYCKIFAAEARAIPAFGPVPEIIPLYLIYRPANNIPYATMEEDLPGQFERYCGREAPAGSSEVGQKCCAFQHWLYQWTNGNILVTDLEGVGWKVTNVRIATKTKGYQGLKENCCPSSLEQFVLSHQCNRYCELLALKNLEPPQPPPKGKGSRSPVTARKAPSAQSSPQLQKKGPVSPQAARKGSVSPKSARRGPDSAAEPRARGGDSGRAGRPQ